MIDLIQQRLASYKANSPIEEQSALFQYGPYKDQDLKINNEWVVNVLSEKITSIDWQSASTDVARFLKPVEQKSLKLWGEKFFLDKLSKLIGTSSVI
jgi:hypothetical protein